MESCTYFCCYNEPSDPIRCGKKVKKRGKTVRCKREGIRYCDKTAQYFCAKHYDEIIASIDMFLANEMTYSPKRVVK